MTALDSLTDRLKVLEGDKRSQATDAWNMLGVEELFQPLPPIPWLCEGLGLAPGAVTLVAGYGYSRKTMALQALGLSVAAGRSVWGVYSCRQGPVVHLDYEQGRRLTSERYQRLGYGMGLTREDIPQGALRVACMPRVYLEGQEAIDSLMPVIEGAALVIVDSLRAAFPHADENSSDVRSYLDALNHVSERTGATVAVIHHARKPQKDAAGTATHAIRGSSALFDACQTVYVFTGEKDTPTTVHHQKDRIRGSTLQDFGLSSEDVGGPQSPRQGLRLVHLESEQIGRWEADREAARVKGEADRAVDVIRGTLKRFSGTFKGSRDELRSACGIKTTAFVSAITQMVNEGQVRKDGSYHAPVWVLNPDPS